MRVDEQWKRWNEENPDQRLTRTEYRASRPRSNSGPDTKYKQAEFAYKSALSGLEPILLVPDSHHPFQDQRACDLVLQVGRALSPSTVITLGDQNDFFSVSSHSRNPERARAHTLASELQSTRAWYNDLEAIGALRNVAVMGNHEARLEKYLADHAPALAELPQLELRSLLGLENWEYVPYRHHTRVGKLYLTHDIGSAGARAHATAGMKFQSNVAIGHTHRIGVHYFGSATGESAVAAMFGWLGSEAAGDEYMHDVNMNVDWHLGFGVGWMEPSGIVHLQAIPIINYTCVVNGVLYKG